MIRDLAYLQSVETLLDPETLDTYVSVKRKDYSLFFMNRDTVAIDTDLLDDAVNIVDVCDEWLESLSSKDAQKVLKLMIKNKQR